MIGWRRNEGQHGVLSNDASNVEVTWAGQRKLHFTGLEARARAYLAAFPPECLKGVGTARLEVHCDSEGTPGMAAGMQGPNPPRGRHSSNG